ncbi:MAG TPA: ABC transporter permease [Gemmatimonadaceae bacterium]|nr:ABC transporter permease [Gemmatimonadaceae bacterium]
MKHDHHDQMDERLEEEVRFHIDMQTERNVRLGMKREEARRQALIDFGGRERWKSEARQHYRSRPFDGVRRDFVLAARSLSRNRGFALTAILTLALGIGASTAIFSVVNAVLLRPLPYADAGRLALIWGDLRARNVNDFPFSPPLYRELKDQAPSFRDIAGVSPFPVTVQVAGDAPEQVRAMGVTSNLLAVLGTRVLHGRDFVPDDAIAPPPPAEPAPGAQPAPAAAPPPPNMLILNHGFWLRRFGGDPSVVGRSVDMGGQPGTIVGVLAPGFELLFPPNTNIEPNPDLLLALRIDYVNAPRFNVFLRLVGRLAPGATFAAAHGELERFLAAQREQHAVMRGADWRGRVEPMHDDLVRDVRPAIFALMGAVTFVLLIACANVANLLLVRAAAREGELAVRVAMGSSPWRIVRQLVAESLVLSLTGAVLAVGLAHAGIRLLTALAPANLPRLGAIDIDFAVLGFATLAAIVAAALFGLVPALRASRPELADVLRAAGRTGGLAGGRLLRNGVVVAEVALSFVLLVGGGLMVRSFVELSRVRPGYDPNGVLTFEIGGRADRTPDEVLSFQSQLRERLAALPGAEAATGVFPLPLDGTLFSARWGQEEAVTDQSRFQQANVHVVFPGYFEAMRTRLLAGRTLTDADNDSSFRGVVIDDVLAARAFPGESAVGKRLFIRTARSPEPEWLEVIGVVEHQRHEGLATKGREAIFLPDRFFGGNGVGTWMVRMTCRPGEACDPARLASAARHVVAELDPRLAVSRMQPYTRLVDRAMTPTRFALVMLGVFATVAAVLACIGLYGVLATTVRQRTAEIGVRVALGAPRRSIFALVIGHGMKLSALGLAIGLVASFWLTRSLTTMLVGVPPTDFATYAAIVGLFIAIALAACSVPARRAASLDPTSALRSG